MTAAHSLANPFAQLISPSSVSQAVARSERLAGLRRRVCRPLDKPLIPLKNGGAGDCQLRAA
jgi:hypothetical protein